MNNVTPYMQNKHSPPSSRQADNAEDSSNFNQKIETLKSSILDTENSCEVHIATFIQHDYIKQFYTLDEDDLSSCVSSIIGGLNDTDVHATSSVQNLSSYTVSVRSIDELCLLFENHIFNGKHNESLPSSWSIRYLDTNGVKIDFVVSRSNAKHFSIACATSIDNIANYIQELNQKLTKKGWFIQFDSKLNNFTVHKIINKK
ncbi:MAG: hypothetical protein K1566_02995 [Candidatus Thiodiazotropha sp. (ex. Lucinisca nassula)]|nr:hypothetical protein [Candidatus Thiodiazotropha sp. (ex. Lucinisca nassula)]